MNDPIISPWIFYLIDLTSPLKHTLWDLSVTTGLGMAFLMIPLFVNSEIKEKQVILKWVKRLGAITIVGVMVNTFTPSSSTIYKMIVASQVTPHNIEVFGDTIENSVDYIFEKINEVVNERDVDNE